MENACANLSTPLESRDVLEASPLADTYVVVVGCVIFIVFLPAVLCHVKAVPLGSTAALLIAGILLVTCRVLDQSDVLVVISRPEVWDCILRLSGILILAYYTDRDGVIPAILERCLKPSQRWEWYLLVTCVTSYLVTITFTSEICCLLLTPAAIHICDKHERSKKEVEVLLLGLMSTSHLASSCSVFGSTHMVLLASHTASSVLPINLHVCVLYLLPAAALTASLNILALLLYFRFRSGNFHRDRLVSEGSPGSHQEMRGLTQDNSSAVYSNGMVQTYHREEVTSVNHNGVREDRMLTACQLETIPEDSVLVIEATLPSLETQALRLRYIDETSSDSSSSDSEENESGNVNEPDLSQDNPTFTAQEFHPSTTQMLRRSENISVNMNLHLTGSFQSLQPDQSAAPYGLVLNARFGISRSMFAISAVGMFPAKPLPCHNPRDSVTDAAAIERVSWFRLLRQRPFPVLLILLLIVLLISLICQALRFPIHIGLVTMGLGSVALAADCIFTRRPASATLREMDWSVIVFLLTYFIWMQGFSTTGVPARISHLLGLSHSPYTSALHVFILAVVAVISSTLVTSPIVTSLVLTQFEPCRDQLALYLYTAWLVSVASAFPLYNSVANATLAYIADSMGHKVAFWRHLLYVAVTMTVLGTIGLLLIYGLLQLR